MNECRFQFPSGANATTSPFKELARWANKAEGRKETKKK
jgi:hypothetical protein